MADQSAGSEDEVPTEASAPNGGANQRTQNVFVSACATEHGANVCALMIAHYSHVGVRCSCGITTKSVPWEGGSV
jgi:hypothetical protein